MRTVVRTMSVAAVLAAALAVAQSAEAAKAPTESFSALQKQIAAGQVLTAGVSPSKHVVRVKLKNGRKFVATFPASQEPSLVASLRAKGAKVHVTSKKKGSGHLRLRYIALIVLGVLALGGGAAYLVQRRRAAERGEPPATPDVS